MKHVFFRRTVQWLRGAWWLQDGHFMRSSTMCWKGFKLDYYLRLEDMQQWFPCWMHVCPTPSSLPGSKSTRVRQQLCRTPHKLHSSRLITMHCGCEKFWLR